MVLGAQNELRICGFCVTYYMLDVFKMLILRDKNTVKRGNDSEEDSDLPMIAASLNVQDIGWKGRDES